MIRHKLEHRCWYWVTHPDGDQEAGKWIDGRMVLIWSRVLDKCSLIEHDCEWVRINPEQLFSEAANGKV